LRIYISGPITGYPLGNKPAFSLAKESLTKKGHEVISPFDDESQEATDETLKDNYGDKYWKVLSDDVYKLSKVEALVFLPGWEQSKGARLEAYIGLLNGFPMFEYRENGWVLDELTASFVAGVCAAQWMPEVVKKLAGVGPPLLSHSEAPVASPKQSNGSA
jgi:hypothetical protein